jgi:hypothetical protein
MISICLKVGLSQPRQPSLTPNIASGVPTPHEETEAIPLDADMLEAQEEEEAQVTGEPAHSCVPSQNS